jgi:hypothetical protein
VEGKNLLLLVVGFGWLPFFRTMDGREKAITVYPVFVLKKAETASTSCAALAVGIGNVESGK